MSIRAKFEPSSPPKGIVFGLGLKSRSGCLVSGNLYRITKGIEYAKEAREVCFELTIE